MIHIAIRVRELVSSNLDALVARAGDPAKALHLLQTEIEESLISLHGDLGKARRHQERLVEQAASSANVAEEWTGKAKTAMDHGREDLARSALLAREDGRLKADRLGEEAKAMASEIESLGEVIAQLEGKRADTLARIKSLQAANSEADRAMVGDSKADRHLDRIERMERRADYAAQDLAGRAAGDIEAEIAALRRDTQLDAELAAMKAASKPAVKQRKRKAG